MKIKENDLVKVKVWKTSKHKTYRRQSDLSTMGKKSKFQLRNKSY